MFFIIPRRASKALLYMTNQQMNRCLKDLCEICGFNTPYTITYYKNNVRHDEVTPKYELIGTHAGCRDEIHRPLRLQIHEALHRHHRIRQERRHQENGGGFQEEIVRIFVENYSLFIGINVYLPRIIVRIFVDFD